MRKTIGIALFLLFPIAAVAAPPSISELTDLFNTDSDSSLEMHAAASVVNQENENRIIGYCTGKEYNRLIDEFMRSMKRGENYAALGSAQLAARVAATCATVRIRKGQTTKYEVYAMQVGTALVYSNAARQGKKDADIKRAIRYLEYAEANGIHQVSGMLADIKKKK